MLFCKMYIFPYASSWHGHWPRTCYWKWLAGKTRKENRKRYSINQGFDSRPVSCILFHFKIENNRKLYSWPVANNFFISTILRFYQSGYIPYIKGLGHQMDWAFIDMTLWLGLGLNELCLFFLIFKGFSDYLEINIFSKRKTVLT